MGGPSQWGARLGARRCSQIRPVRPRAVARPVMLGPCLVVRLLCPRCVAGSTRPRDGPPCSRRVPPWPRASARSGCAGPTCRRCGAASGGCATRPRTPATSCARCRTCTPMGPGLLARGRAAAQRRPRRPGREGSAGRRARGRRLADGVARAHASGGGGADRTRGESARRAGDRPAVAGGHGVARRAACRRVRRGPPPDGPCAVPGGPRARPRPAVRRA